MTSAGRGPCIAAVPRGGPEGGAASTPVMALGFAPAVGRSRSGRSGAIPSSPTAGASAIRTSGRSDSATGLDASASLLRTRELHGHPHGERRRRRDRHAPPARIGPLVERFGQAGRGAGIKGCVPELAPGSVVAGCRIDAVVGRGGMGVVYAATQLALAAPVALKVIVPELASDPEFRLRFERESRLAASIEHPNVIPVHEAGEGDGLLYLRDALHRGHRPARADRRGGAAGAGASGAARGPDGGGARRGPPPRAGPPRREASQRPDRSRRTTRSTAT